MTQYLDLLARGADPATGRRMVFGRLPIRPREADLLGAVAELAPDHVTYIGTRQRLADALDCSTRSIDRYVSAVASAGYLTRSRQGNGVRLAIDVAAVVDGPQVSPGCDNNGQQAPHDSAPKPQGCDKSGQTRQTTTVPSRRDLGRQLVAAIVQAGTLAIAIVFYSRHCRRTKRPVNAVRSGDAWQGLLFADDGPTVSVSAPKPARKVATPRVAKSRQVATPTATPSISIPSPPPTQKSPSIKTMVKPGTDGPSKTLSWGRELKREHLRDVRVLLQELYPRAVAFGAAHSDAVQEHRFVAFACEIDRTWPKMSNPIGVFTQRMTTPDRFGRTWRQRGTAKEDEDKARKMIQSLRQTATAPPVHLHCVRDPDEAAVANRDDQVRRLMEHDRYGAATAS